METEPCRLACEYLEKNEVEPVNEYLPSGSAPWYIPMPRIKALFEDEPDGLKLESIFLCPCNRCERDGGLVEDRSTKFNNCKERELRNDYAAIYALLIYIHRPGLIQIFQKYELKLSGTSYLREVDFLVLCNENLVDFDVIKRKVLRFQYSFLVRTLRSYSDITAIPSKELLPIEEDREPKGVGSFAEVRCFKFQDEEYRSQDFGQASFFRKTKVPKANSRAQITRFARKIFKKTLDKPAAKEWNNLQNLSKATNHQHLMPALGAYWHGTIFFILQEEAAMSLHDYLRGQGDKYDSDELWNQLRGLADGLDKLHQLCRGTKIAYHQDLKPANILIVRGTLKIADFGLLEFKPVSLDDTGTTGVDSAHNTGYYAAPRPALRRGRYTREDDIWSLACIISELATADIQGRDEIVKYREARIAGGASGKDTPRFFLEQKVKSQVLDRHSQLQRMVHSWTSTDQGDETRIFQGKFYSTAFFTLLDSMFRHGQTPSTFSEVSGQVAVPDAGQVAETIERLRKEAMPVPSLNAGTEQPGSSPHRTFRVSDDLVPSLEHILEEFQKTLNRKDERKFRLTTLADLKQVLVNLQARRYAERRQQGLKHLVPLIEAFEQFGQLLGEFCDSNVFMAFIWVRKSP
jgi:serine/threonine protein kinase